MIGAGALVGLLGNKTAWLVAAGALILLWGGCGYRQADQAKAELARERLANMEAVSRAERENRDLEAALQAGNAAAQADLAKARQALVARAAAAEQRLRDAAAWAPSPAAAASASACRDLGAPAVAVLPGETRRDLVALAEGADAVSVRLRACQARLVDYQRIFSPGK